ncbi:MAG: carbamoyltransferase [candidate division Zixibacteria bacterium]|jgi:carbamoyltransferase|nr:carbamoyltransferase [candidate division Zixibacteria bacterium]
MKILGISCFYHDAAAAIAVDGKLVAAASEERFSRIKHDPELPVQAVGYCLARAGLQINDLDYIAFYDKPFTKFERIVTGYMATPFRSYRAFLAAMPVWLRRKLFTEHVIHKELGYDGEMLFVPHHLSHAAGAFFSSPFESAAILTIDGVGEWATASYGIGDRTDIRLLAQMNYPHSVGLLYSAFTYYLGFQVNSAEYKVMGLAPYGTPRFSDLIERELVTIHDDGSIHLDLKYFTFHHGLRMVGRRFEQLFGRPRRNPETDTDQFDADVAASIQAVTEKIVLRMATHVRTVTDMSRLCLSGGVALNCSANGMLERQGLFDDIYVQPASGDAGGAVGACLYASHKLGMARTVPQPFFSLGPSFDNATIESFLDRCRVPYAVGPDDELVDRVTDALCSGRIVAVFRGPMEFGPRALGFRSILADPRDNAMKAKINAAVKYREPFRPFAPAVLAECVCEYFDCTGESPYMLFTYAVRQEKRSVIPAVTHIDNSSRIQSVAKEDNPLLHKILTDFKQKTGVAVLLNTSFNLRGHPIVHTPEQALETFCSGGIDLLLIGRYLVDKRNMESALIDSFRIEKGLD